MHDHAVSRRTLGRVIALIACALSVTAAAQSNGGVARISKPGQYSGYSQALYDGHQLTSQYVAMRDGTRLAVDIFRPTLNGKVIEDKLPVVWMHTPYNRRNYRDGLTAANYPGKALQLVKYGYVVAVADFRGLYASFGLNTGLQPWRVAGCSALRCLRHHRMARQAAVEHRQDRHVGLLGDRRQPDAGAQHRAAESEGRSFR